MLWTSVAEATSSLSLKPDLIRQTITGGDEAEVIQHATPINVSSVH